MDPLPETGRSKRESSLADPIRFRWDLRTLFLLTAAVAVWTGYFRCRQPLPGLRDDISRMEEMTAELVIVDPKEITVAWQPQPWLDRPRWDIYVPGDGFVMRLATREIAFTGLAPIVAQAPISPGRHRIELRYTKKNEQWEISLRIDDRSVLTPNEPGEWHQEFGDCMGHWGCFRHPYNGRYADLYRLRFVHPGTPTNAPPANGLLLWIESPGAE